MGEEGETSSDVKRKIGTEFGENNDVTSAFKSAFHTTAPPRPELEELIVLSDDLDDESLIDESSLSLSLGQNMSTEDMILMDEDMIMNSSFLADLDEGRRALSPLLPPPTARRAGGSLGLIPLKKSMSSPHPALETQGKSEETNSAFDPSLISPTTTPKQNNVDRAVDIPDPFSVRSPTDEPSPPIPFRKVMSTPAVSSRSSSGSKNSYGWMSHSPFLRRTSVSAIQSLSGSQLSPSSLEALKKLQFDGSVSDASSHGSVMSPFSTVAEQEMEQLARQLATPTKRADKKSSLRSNMNPSNIFRSVRIGTPTMSMFGSSFRSSNATTSGEDSSGTPVIGRNDTMKTTKSEEDGDLERSASFGAGTSRHRRYRGRGRNSATELMAESRDSNSLPTGASLAGIFGNRETLAYLVYLSTFAVFGAVFRVYVGRFFGVDCENYPDGVHDFLTPISRHICVTSSGGTEQIGGSIFSDLPANMIGSFTLGLFTNLRPDLWPPLPWLNADHPLQRNRPLHVAVKTGLCGSLTTFSSWNAQMVFMMDGSKTELGSQILPACFGYLLGLSSALWCFTFGTHVSSWLNRWRRPETIVLLDPHSHARIDELSQGGESSSTSSSQLEQKARSVPSSPLRNQGPGIISWPPCMHGSKIPFLLLTALVAAFILGDALLKIPFYRGMWANALLAPLGALCRWQLAKRLNGGAILSGQFHWVPWGTLLANLSACVISAGLLGVVKLNGVDEWHDQLFIALRVGFAGSLSTVSTWIKEIHELQNTHPHHAKSYIYAGMTVIPAALLSLLVYSPIVRSG